jgi:autotransporter-associated beta strand protein
VHNFINFQPPQRPPRTFDEAGVALRAKRATVSTITANFMKNAQRFLAAALLVPVLTYTTRADIITQWTFETSIPATAGPFSPETGVGLGAATGFHAGATTYSSPAGNGSAHSFSSTAWAVGDYYQFTTNATGWQDLTLSWDHASSSTGPGRFDLMYSTDGTNFNLVPGFDDYVAHVNGAPNTAWSAGGTVQPIYGFTADLSSFTALNNNFNATFRLVMANTTSANETTPGTVAAGGTSRVDNFTVSGVTFGTADKFWDNNGTTAGVGGNANWTGASLTWNSVAAGTGPVTALGPLDKAVFQGTPGVVTVGAGATASNGLFFNVDGYTVTGGTLTLAGGAPKIQVTNDGELTTISATLSGSAGMNKAGAGRLKLTANNTYSGTTTISGGVLEVSNDNNLGDPAAAVALAGGTLKFTGSATLNANRAVSGAGTLEIPTGATLTVSGAAATGLLTLANAGALVLSGATPAIGGIVFMQASTVTHATGDITLTGNITTNNTAGTATLASSVDVGGANRTFTIADGTAPVDFRLTKGITSSANTVRINKFGDGTMEVNDNTGLLGGFNIGGTGATANTGTPGGKLIVKNEFALGGTELRFNAGTLENGAAGPLQFPNAISVGAGQLADGAIFSGAPMEFFGAVTLFKAGASAAVAYQHRITVNTDVTFSGGLNEPATGGGSGTSTGLTFAGTGKVFLPSTNSIVSAGITVDGAKVYASGNFSAATKPPFFVVNGGTLGGTNAFGEGLGNVAVQGNGILNPGTPADITGVLNTLNLDIQAGGYLNVELAGTSSGNFDQVNVTGTVTLAGALSVALAPGYTPTPNDTFIIILNDGVSPAGGDLTGAFAGLPDNATFQSGTYFYKIDYDGGDGNDVMLTAIPEPGTAGLFLAGLALCVGRRRRRQG